MNSKINRILLLVSALLLSLLGSSYFVTVPTPNRTEDHLFSPERIAKDIEAISQEPRSLLHPEARTRARLYLEERLADLGGSVDRFHYDSVLIDSLSANLTNVVATWESPSDSTSSYLMLVAHYDSSNKKRRIGKEHLSHGAADDGYGVGVALELARLATSCRASWSQGLRILFTDGEEFGMLGMQEAIRQNPELFDRVGLLINIEARGMKGPALLFETSPHNEALIQLYSHARLPFSYSLTSSVYNFLPNYTDFQLVKGDIPGMNFAVIDDLWYYHSEFDNIENIHLGSLQHYGDQLVPITQRYLTDKSYRLPSALRAERDLIFFTLPFVGLVSYTPTIGVGLLLFALSLLLLFGFRLGALQPSLKIAFYLFAKSIVAAIQAIALVLLYAFATSRDYKLISLVVTRWDYWIAVGIILLVSIQLAISYRIRMKHDCPVFGNYLFGALLNLAFWSILLQFGVGENFFTTIPLLLAAGIGLLYSLKKVPRTIVRLAALVVICAIILLMTPFITSLIIALGIGASPLVILPAYLGIILIIPLGSLVINE